MNYRGGDVILVSPMTEVDPVGKGGDHIEGKGVEKAERHLEMDCRQLFIDVHIEKHLHSI